MLLSFYVCSCCSVLYTLNRPLLEIRIPYPYLKLLRFQYRLGQHMLFSVLTLYQKDVQCMLRQVSATPASPVHPMSAQTKNEVGYGSDQRPVTLRALRPNSYLCTLTLPFMNIHAKLHPLHQQLPIYAEWNFPSLSFG